MLDLEHSFNLVKNLPIAEYLVVSNQTELELKIKIVENKIGFPCWIKLSTAEHKASLGALEKCNDFQDLLQKFKKLSKKFPESKFIIQENIEGIELIIGRKTDSVFQDIILIGAGGNFTEILQDKAFSVLPLEKIDILRMLTELKITRLLKEKNCNLSKLAKLIENIASLDIKEADFNPVIINEKSAVIVDARILP